MTREEALRTSILNYYTDRYPEVFDRILRAADLDADLFCLMGAENYIFKTGGVLWAVDPMFNTPRSGITREAVKDRLHELFDRLDFVLLTHSHIDHLDTELFRLFPKLRLIVPDHLMNWIPPECENVTCVHYGDSLTIGDIRIDAFRSLHYDKGTTVGVEETGYKVTAGKYALLFPTDVREYDAAKYPDLGTVTHVFGHVWLGRRKALDYPQSGLCAEQAAFLTSFGARVIYLAHIAEAEREPEDLWTYAHAGLLTDAILTRQPDANVRIPMLGYPEFL